MNAPYPALLERLTGQLKKPWVIVIAAAVLVAVAAWFFFAGGKDKSRGRPPPAVVTATASVKDVTVVEHAVGTVVANTTVEVTARVTGHLVKAAFREGDIIKQGDLLFVIDPRPFQAALDQALAQRAKDQAQRLNAVATKRRIDALYAQNAISASQKDAADADAKSAVAAVAADDAAVATARLNLGYTQIRSPVDGKTGPILIQPGNLVAANSANPLVVLTEIEPVKISLALPQSLLPAIQARDRAGALTVAVDNRQTGGGKLSAKIDFLSNQVSATTGTIELRATFANKDHRLVPGQMVDVDVALATLAKATVIPREAVNEGPAGRYVFVVGRDEIARMRPVTVLYDDGKTAAVKGVRKGETVVTDGQLRVVPDAKVAARKPGKAP